MTKNRRRIALVLSGGGARGAYEAGVVHYMRTMLPKAIRMRGFDIYTGSSVGAITASFLASTAHDLSTQGELIYKMWSELDESNIYRRDAKAVVNFIAQSTKGIFLSLLQSPEKHAPRFHSLFDITPLRPYIRKAIPWKMISKNISSGVINALSLIGTNVFTGKTELFIEKHPSVKYTGEYIHHFTTIKPEHAIASAAIPIIFPPVLVDGTAYTDGGLRLNTPMSPAIQLGADAIVVISLHHRPKSNEDVIVQGKKGELPSIGLVLGRIMNSLFLDRIQYDIEQLTRINRICDWGEMKYGKDFLKDINGMLVAKGIAGDVANRGLKKLDVLRLEPSMDLAELFSQCYQKEGQRHFSSFEKFIIRILDIDPTSGVDFLSYISFLPEYLKSLLALGFEDAAQSHDQLVEFLENK